MDSIRIQGGVALQGKVRMQGSKNAALPILAATLLTDGQSVLSNCPRIADVYAMISILKDLGCSVNWQEKGLCIDASGLRLGEMGSEAVRGMRSSLCLLGALLGRCGQVVLEHPGGCVIGQRPIDLHLEALKQMGVVFTQQEGRLRASADRLSGAHILLPFPSVGATENVILAAVSAQGETLLEGAAKEPEIGALCRYLKSCGAQIWGEETGQIRIRGNKPLWGAEFVIPADRIVAGTYLFACLGAGGNVLLEEAPWEEMEAVLRTAERMGARVWVSKEGVYVQAPRRPAAVTCIRTAPYPGFPTDLQSVALAVAAAAEGDTLIQETIFEDRFRVAKELGRMGAQIEIQGPKAVLARGRAQLKGARVEAQELRGGAALAVAGLMARGETTVTQCQYICRGYENLCRDFRELGARVTGA